MTPAASANVRILLLPGWLNSDDQHWQSRWERLHGHQRVEQDDWLWPRRGDWMARLDEVIQSSDRPAVLVAHSLGCHLVAAWAAHSAHTSQVLAALLVAPPDVERDDMPPNLFSWRPAVGAPLPFPAHVLGSDDDPFCAPDRARQLAARWGCGFSSLGPCGHINTASGLGDWPQGHAMLQALLSARG